MFILCSISSDLEIWSVNHTSISSIYENPEVNVIKTIKFLGEISSHWPTIY